MGRPVLADPKPRLRCKHCPGSTYSSLDVARLVGWRVWSGITVGGKHVEDVVCPRCAGTEVPPEPKPEGWHVRCKTCDWDSREDADMQGDEPLDAANAKLLAREHRCDPLVELCPPGGSDTWYGHTQIRPDGSLRDDPRAASPLASPFSDGQA